ncbi:hypothetical protein [Klebsiella variicola]|nr:hypothetical protein [Klebsiella variicola]
MANDWQPYFDRADRPRVNAWQTLTNDGWGCVTRTTRPTPPADTGQRSAP